MNTETIKTACYHPMSCLRCRAAGTACGGHNTGQPEHDRCTGLPVERKGGDVA